MTTGPVTEPTEPTETDSLLPIGAIGSVSAVQESPQPLSSTASSSLSTGQQILDLAIPAAGALLIDPLMTLVDTAFVGRFTLVTAVANDAPAASYAAAAPLAGMGSAAALLTFGFYVCNFLCTATTPLVARERASGRPDQAVLLSGQVLSLALLLGAILTIVLWSFQGPLLQLMGTDRTGEAANSYAVSFLSVRALAAPAVLCIEASTGILRGYLDTKTPIVVLIVANVINFVLDVILIVLLGLGPMGAAIATTTAEWIGAALFLAVLAGKLPAASGALARAGRCAGVGGDSGQPESASTGRHTPSTNNDTASSSLPVAIVPILSIPRWDSVRPLMVASSSVFLRTLVLQASLSAAAAMAARGGVHFQDMITGTAATAATAATAVAVETAASSIAAHQIGIQLWLLCSFLCDSLAAASQGLIADALGRQDSDSVLDVSKTIFAYSFVLGMALALVLQIGASTHWLMDLFTQDPLTRAALGRILPLIVVAQPLNALVFAADGVLQGAAEFPFQARAMLVSGLTAVATFLALETLGSDVDTLVHVWAALIALQTMRGLTSLGKLIDSNGPINLLSSK
jgi:Na+-driven multidrug efflux pump